MCGEVGKSGVAALFHAGDARRTCERLILSHAHLRCCRGKYVFSLGEYSMHTNIYSRSSWSIASKAHECERYCLACCRGVWCRLPHSCPPELWLCGPWSRHRLSRCGPQSQFSVGTIAQRLCGTFPLRGSVVCHRTVDMALLQWTRRCHSHLQS